MTTGRINQGASCVRSLAREHASDTRPSSRVGDERALNQRLGRRGRSPPLGTCARGNANPRGAEERPVSFAAAGLLRAGRRHSVFQIFSLPRVYSHGVQQDRTFGIFACVCVLILPLYICISGICVRLIHIPLTLDRRCDAETSRIQVFVAGAKRYFTAHRA